MNTKHRGGYRPGAGRKPDGKKLVKFRVESNISAVVEANKESLTKLLEEKAKLIKNSIAINSGL